MTGTLTETIAPLEDEARAVKTRLSRPDVYPGNDEGADYARLAELEAQIEATRLRHHLYEDDVAVADEAMRRITRALFAMPYMGGSAMRHPSSANGLRLSLLDVATNLELMVETLTAVAEEAMEKAGELARYRRLVNAGRELMSLLTDEGAS